MSAAIDRTQGLYVRGSIGESLSFILFPFILLGIKKIYEDGYSFKNIAITGLLLAILITTHNVMTVLFGIVILLIVLLAIFKKQIRFALDILLSLIYSLCISAFFWIPAIFEKHLVLLSKIPIADRSANFVHFEQLLIPKWGYGVPIDSNGFGYQVGIPQLIVLVIALIFVIKNKDFKAAAFLISATISLLLFSQSSFVWSHTPLLSEINYPWTILAIIALLISLLAGYLTKLGKTFLFLVLILGALSVILVFPHAKPQQAVNRGDDFYITNQATTTSSNELMPLWVKKLPNQKPEKKIEVRLGQVNNISSTSRKISFSVDLPKPETVRINTIYYPGWKFFVDGKITKINYNNDSGVMNINVNSGNHLINGLLEETSLRLLSDAISLVSIFSLIVFAIPSYKPLRKTK